MQVDVHNVESHVARTACTEHRVKVSSVVVHQSSTLVYEFCDFRNVLLKHAERVRVCHHHGSHGVVEQSLEVINVNISLRRALHLHHFESANGSRCRVSAVSRVRNDNLHTFLVAAALMVCPDDHESCEFSVCSREGVESEFAETSDSGELFLQCIVNVECTLYGVFRLHWVQCGELRHVSHLFIYHGIVFHCTAAERIESVVHAEIVFAVVSIVSYHCHLVAFRQSSIFLSALFGRNVIFAKLVFRK